MSPTLASYLPPRLQHTCLCLDPDATSAAQALVKGDLVFLHTYQDVLAFVSMFPTVFFSHQWLSWTQPDPNKVHYNAIRDAAELLIEMHDINKKELYIWIECAPQWRSIARASSPFTADGIIFILSVG